MSDPTIAFLTMFYVQIFIGEMMMIFHKNSICLNISMIVCGVAGSVLTILLSA